MLFRRRKPVYVLFFPRCSNISSAKITRSTLWVNRVFFAWRLTINLSLNSMVPQKFLSFFLSIFSFLLSFFFPFDKINLICCTNGVFVFALGSCIVWDCRPFLPAQSYSLTKINLSYNNAIIAATVVFRAHSCTRNQIHLVLC